MMSSSGPQRRGSAHLVWCIVATVGAPLLATTVIPPTFEELVSRAEIAFEGEVIATEAQRTVEREGNPIVTTVTFRVARALKGKVGATVALEFLGGTVDGLTYSVDGMPTFRVGDRDVLFAITSQRLVSPLVGMMYGRVQVIADSATRQAMVRRHDGQPLRDLSNFGSTDKLPLLSSTPAMSLAAFENAVIAEDARQVARVR